MFVSPVRGWIDCAGTEAPLWSRFPFHWVAVVYPINKFVFTLIYPFSKIKFMEKKKPHYDLDAVKSVVAQRGGGMH